jgi:hypothetical protein
MSGGQSERMRPDEFASFDWRFRTNIWVIIPHRNCDLAAVFPFVDERGIANRSHYLDAIR